MSETIRPIDQRRPKERRSDRKPRRIESRIRRVAPVQSDPSPSPPHPHVLRRAKPARRNRPAVQAPVGAAARLASPRDRARLRERVLDERARVEAVLASAPLPLDEAPGSRTARFAPDTAEWAPPVEALHPELAHCPLCESPEVHADEVIQTGSLRLLECGRCEHRWTEAVPLRFSDLGAFMTRGPVRESASA